MCVCVYISLPMLKKIFVFTLLYLPLSHKGMFNCIFPVLGIVPFTGCMKWSYTAVYLPAAKLNENNKNLNLTDALNLLKTFSSEETLHSLTCKERFSTVFFPLWTEMGRERWLFIPIKGHVARMSGDIRHDLFLDFSPCDKELFPFLSQLSHT